MIYTGSWTALYRASQAGLVDIRSDVLPVRISRGTPKFWPAAERFPALAEELADVVTYCDLLAHKYDIDLGQAVREKFNKVSAAQDFPERL